MATAPYEQAINSTRAVLTGIGPDQLDAATPCASWKVSDLVNHVVGGQYMFHSALQGRPPSAAADFVAAAAVRGLRMYAVNDAAVRLVWHLDVDDPDTGYAADVVNSLLAQAAQRS